MSKFARPLAGVSDRSRITQRLWRLSNSASEGSIGGVFASASSAQSDSSYGLDRRLVFGEREFEANDGVHVAVGDVMNELADGPAAGAIRRVELRGRETGDGGGQTRRRLGDRVNVLAALASVRLVPGAGNRRSGNADLVP